MGFDAIGGENGKKKILLGDQLRLVWVEEVLQFDHTSEEKLIDHGDGEHGESR